MRDHVTDYAYIITKFSPVDTDNAFVFEGAFCFEDIPFDIMYSMLKDANYFGFPPDSPYITNIVSAQKKRHEVKRSSDSRQRFVLSEERIRKLFVTGKTMDHVREFRPLTNEEIRIIAENFLNNDKIEYRFFKFGYSNKCIELGLAENFGIHIWDASRGYGKNHFQTIIKHPKAISVFKSFTEYFWDNCTMSDEESKQKMMDLISEYL